MAGALRIASRERLRRRQLASDARAARFARSQAWTRQWSFVRSRPWAIVLAVALFPALFLPLALSYDGAVRGGIIGASLASGIWLAVTCVLLFSGAASSVAGTVAEEWTASELRPLQRKGWRLVNGLKVRGDTDIDHVLVGPGGVVVVETKWSSEPWRSASRGGSFTADRLTRAVGQAQRNAADISTQLHRALGDIPVRAVLAVWSPEDVVNIERRGEAHGVEVMAGGRIREWILTLEDLHLDAKTVAALWRAIDKQAVVRDERDLKVGGFTPTVGQLMWRWVWQPSLGFAITVYAMAGIVKLSGPLPQALGMLTIGLGCLVALRRPPLRQAALGSAAAFIMLVGLAVVTIVTG